MIYLSLGNGVLGGTSSSQHKSPNSPIEKRFFGHEQESGSQDRLYNLGANTLVQTSNAFIGDDLSEAIQDGRIAFLILALDLHTSLDNTKGGRLETILKFATVKTHKNGLHVRISDAGGSQLGDGTEKEEIKVSKLSPLGDEVLDLFENSVLDDGVDDQNQGSTDTSIETLRTLFVQHLDSSLEETISGFSVTVSLSGSQASLKL